MCLPNHCNHLFRWITFHYKQGSISFMFYFLRSRVACSVLYSCSSDNNVSSVVAQQNQNKIDVYNQHTMYSLRLRGSVERGPTTVLCTPLINWGCHQRLVPGRANLFHFLILTNSFWKHSTLERILDSQFTIAAISNTV